jgi:exodeoxyribonuclease-3
MSNASLRLVSWNVNGLRAAWRKGLRSWLAANRPDILFLQEIRAGGPELAAIRSELEADGYQVSWNSATRAGYSGTALVSRIAPLRLDTSLALGELDAEGRVIEAHFPGFAALVCYFPNGTSGAERTAAKLRFFAAFAERAAALGRQYPLVLAGGDLNIAHTAADLANAAANTRTSGFLPAERAAIDDLVVAGFVDTYRHHHPGQSGAYSWWCPWSQCRERNIGWRFDYLFISQSGLPSLDEASIHPWSPISDHAPISVRLRSQVPSLP